MLAVVLGGCLRGDVPPTTPGAIRGAVDRFLGQRVQVTGVVRRFRDRGDAAYYVLEDVQRNRLGLRPASRVAGLSGCRTTIRGVVRFDPGFGLYLEVSTVVSGCMR